jgi:hypothetical protein
MSLKGFTSLKLKLSHRAGSGRQKEGHCIRRPLTNINPILFREEEEEDDDSPTESEIRRPVVSVAMTICRIFFCGGCEISILQ